MQKNKAICFLLILMFLPIVGFSQTPAAPAWVYDGPDEDLDYWTTSTNSFQANWQAVAWPSEADGKTKRYRWEIKEGDVLLVNGYVPDESGNLNPDTYLNTSLSFIEGASYYIGVRGDYFTVAGGWFDGTLGSSNGFLVDTVGPVVSIDPLPATQSTNTFAVSWDDGNDGSGSGIATHDVQYRAGAAAWVNWLSGTGQTSADFTGNNGETYSFRVRARDRAGNLGNYSTAVSTTINAMSGALSISTSPSYLSFSSAENTLSLDLNILATGAAGITLTSIREERTYTTWGTETQPPESINFTIPGGTTRTLTRTIGLDSIQRSRALGSGTEGSFTLTFNISGQDNLGNPVSGMAGIPVAVSAGLPTTLNIGSVSLQLPPSPYYVGDVVGNASIVINATGSGTVQGQILVDGGTGWSANPSFSANISGLTTINIQGNIPTSLPGQHTVRVELTSPEILSAQAVYTVIDANASPFTPAAIVLIPGVAELLDLDGTALATYNNAGGYEDFNFTGSARLNLISLGNTEIPEVALDHLVIRYYDSDPITAHIVGGTVEKEAQGSQPILTLAGGALKVRRLFFQGNANPETDHLLADAVLYWQEIAQELFLVEGLQIKTQGLEEGNFSMNPGQQKEFEAFGKRFTVHDQGGNIALVLARDEANNRHSFTMAGQVSWPEKSGTVTNYQPLGNFSGFTLYSDGEVQADLPINNYAVIPPDYLTLNRLHLDRVSNNLVLNLHGRIENLPFPLDNVAEDFVLAFDPFGNLVGNVPVVNEQGHALDSGGASQWEYEIATLDLTYLKADLFFGQGGALFRDMSLIRLGVDVYLNLKEAGGGMAAPEERRISFGEPDGGGNLIDGVEIDLSGQINWPASDIQFQDKKLDVSILTLRIENIGISQEPSFKFVAAGSIIVDFPLVEGGGPISRTWRSSWTETSPRAKASGTRSRASLTSCRWSSSL